MKNSTYGSLVACVHHRLDRRGRDAVEALRLNNELAVEVRRNWVLAGWHPPEMIE